METGVQVIKLCENNRCIFLQHFQPETHKKANTIQSYSNIRKKTSHITKNINQHAPQTGNVKIETSNTSLHGNFSENLSYQPLIVPRATVPDPTTTLPDPIGTGGGSDVIFGDSSPLNEYVNLPDASKLTPRWSPTSTNVFNEESNQAELQPKIIICKSKLIRRTKLKKGKTIILVYFLLILICIM